MKCISLIASNTAQFPIHNSKVLSNLPPKWLHFPDHKASNYTPLWLPANRKPKSYLSVRRLLAGSQDWNLIIPLGGDFLAIATHSMRASVHPCVNTLTHTRTHAAMLRNEVKSFCCWLLPCCNWCNLFIMFSRRKTEPNKSWQWVGLWFWLCYSRKDWTIYFVTAPPCHTTL